MRIGLYSSQARCLFVHDEEIRRWVEHPWLRRGETLYSLRDLTDDPGIDHIIGCVFHSTDDPNRTTHAVPQIRGGWIFFDVLSADRFLDDYVADWQKVDGDDEQSHHGSLRTIDGAGVIAGPVDRIVFVNMDEHSVEALALVEDP